MSGGGGGSGGGGNSGTGNPGDCETEYGLLSCLEEEHFRLGFSEESVEDQSNGNRETTRSLYACGAAPTAEEPIDRRTILARDDTCVAYRGSVREPFAAAALDAGPIELFSNEQVVSLQPDGTCYDAQVLVDPFFFAGELITVDVSGGDDVDPFTGVAAWLPAPLISGLQIDNNFYVEWTTIEPEAVVTLQIEAADPEGVTTKIRCSANDTGEILVAREIFEELPDETLDATVRLTRTILFEPDEAPGLVIVRQGTTDIVL
jgi:hypothetical protein